MCGGLSLKRGVHEGGRRQIAAEDVLLGDGNYLELLADLVEAVFARGHPGAERVRLSARDRRAPNFEGVHDHQEMGRLLLHLLFQTVPPNRLPLADERYPQLGGARRTRPRKGSGQRAQVQGGDVTDD